MGCCRGKSGDKEVERPLQEGEKRSCTDVVWLLVFSAFLVGMFILTGVAWSKGNYRRIFNGIDYRGCTCGTKSVVENGVCSESDSEATPTLGSKSFFASTWDLSNGPNSLTPFIVCAKACDSPPVLVVFEAAGNTTAQLGCVDDASGDIVWGAGATLSSQESSLNCSSVGKTKIQVYKSKTFFNYCIPTSLPSGSGFQNKIDTAVGDSSWSRAMESLNRGTGVVIGMCFFALVIAYSYLQLLNWCAKPAVYGSLLLILVSLAASSAFLWNSATALQESSPDTYKDDVNWQMRYYGALAMIVVTVLFFCFILFMRKRIALACEMVKLTGKSLRAAKLLPLVPAVVFLVALGIVAIWAATTVMLFSTGEIKEVQVAGLPDGVGKKVVMDETLQRVFLYHLFGLLWVQSFLVAFVECIVVFVAVAWYFAPSVDGKKQSHASPIWSALKTVCRYHLGSIAIGSILIAIIKSIRLYIEYTAKQMERAGGKKNKFAKCAICCARCCTACLQRCMEFINKNAYIQMALTKGSFCSSAMTAFKLIVSNMARVGALTAITGGLMLIGRLVAAAVPTMVAYAVLTSGDYANVDSDDAIANPLAPCLLVFLVGWLVGGLYANIYETSVDTMLMCYIHNEKHHVMDDAECAALAKLNAKSAKAGYGPNGEEEALQGAAASTAGAPLNMS